MELNYIGFEPITATATLKRINRLTNGVGETSPYICNSDNVVFCTLEIAPKSVFSTLCKAEVKLKLQSQMAGKIGVYKVNNVGLPIPTMADAPQYVHVESDGTNTYATFDVTDAIEGAKTQTHIFALVASSGEIQIERFLGLTQKFVVDDDYASVVTFGKDVGDKGSYAVNVVNGKLKWHQPLYSAQGDYCPAKFSLVYDASALCTPSTLPSGRVAKGWKINYFEHLQGYHTNNLYFDQNGSRVCLIRKIENPNVYYQANGKKELVLKRQSDGSYLLTDNKTIEKVFSSSGVLTTIREKRGNEPITTQITYTSDGKLSTVTDGMGEQYVFDYTTANKIYLKKGTTSLVEMEVENDELKSVKYLQGEAMATYDFVQGANGELVEVTDNLSGEKVVFSYSDDKRVASYVNKVGTNVVDSKFFKYGFKQTEVSHCQSCYSKSDAYKVERYYIDGENNVSGGTEAGATASSMAYTQRSNDFIFSQTANDYVYAQRENGIVEVGKTNKAQSCVLNLSAGSQQIAISESTDCVPNATTLEKGSYAFCISAILESFRKSPSGEQSLKAKLQQVNQDSSEKTLCEISFDTNSNLEQFKCKTVHLREDSAQLKVRFEAVGFLEFSLIAGGAMLSKLPTRQTWLCLNVPTGQALSTKDVELTNWYPLQKMTLSWEGDNQVTGQIFTQKDYLNTLFSKMKNSTNYDFWYNDGKSFVPGVSGFNLNAGYGARVFSALRCAVVTEDEDKTVLSQYVLESDGLYQRTKYYKYGQTTLEEWTKYDQYFRPILQKDVNGIYVENTYNAKGNLTQRKTYKEALGLANLLEEYTYHTTGNLATQKEKRYGVDYVTSHQYNSDGMLASTTSPNSNTVNYFYDGKQRLSQVNASVDSDFAQNNLTYANGRISRYDNGTNSYYFSYDQLNRLSQVKVDDGTEFKLSITSENFTSGKSQAEMEYTNQDKVKREWDKYGNLTKEWLYNKTTQQWDLMLENVYQDPVTGEDKSDKKELQRTIDNYASRVYNYLYDDLGQLQQVQTMQNGVEVFKTEVEKQGTRLSKVKNKLDQTISSDTTYTYKNFCTDEISKEVHGDVETFYTKDDLNRLSAETWANNDHNGFKREFTYVPRKQGTSSRALDLSVTGTTTYVEKEKVYRLIGGNAVLEETNNVEYDSNGNISLYGTTTYQYDGLNRLVRENNFVLGQTFTYQYDDRGNLVAKCVYDYTTTSLDSVVPTEAKVYNYSTGWEDKLVSVNTIGFIYDQWDNLVPYVINTNTVTYDGCNPTNVDGNVLTWTRGKMLSRFANVNFTYDATGKRVKKQQGSKESHYYYSGNKLAFEKVVQGNTEEVITYIYNGQGAIGFKKGNVAYYYQKNMFGDVTAIYRDATLIARYVYDAYGNCMVLDANGQQNFSTTFIGNVNPIRYRGYYYDVETGLYYCLTRYYNPSWCRWISPDSIEYLDPETLNGLNLYAYCLNNPVMYVDRSGHFPSAISSFGSIDSNIGLRCKIVLARDMSRISISSTPFANVVSRTSVSFVYIDNFLIGNVLCNITETVSTQNNRAGTVYVFSDIGNETISVGFGLNINDCCGFYSYVSSNFGIGSRVQIASITYGAEISLLKGISFSFGTICDNVSEETTINIGWGMLALVCVGIAAFTVGGVPAVAAAILLAI